MNLNGTSSENRHLIFVVVSPRGTSSPPPPYSGVRSTVLSPPTMSEKIRHHLNCLILHGDVRVRHRWYPLARTYTNHSHTTVAKRKGRVVELTHEDHADEVDELAEDVGKPWHLSNSLGTYAHPYGPRKGWRWALRQGYYSVSN
jgi:hypothetical protein